MKFLFQFNLYVFSSLVAFADPVDFNQQIKPLLSNRCFACHGPDKENRKGDLDLSTVEGATENLGGYRAVHPGHPELSTILDRVTLPHSDLEAMPPSGKSDRLSEHQVDWLKRWIREGALVSAVLVQLF